MCETERAGSSHSRLPKGHDFVWHLREWPYWTHHHDTLLGSNTIESSTFPASFRNSGRPLSILENTRTWSGSLGASEKRVAPCGARRATDRGLTCTSR